MFYSSNGPQYNSKVFSPPVLHKGLLGATSSLNSVLQVLFMTKDFREAVERHTRENPHTDRIDRQLTDLFADLKRKTGYTYSITKKLLIKDVWREGDAAEFFEKILRMTNREASQIFRGRMMSTPTCSACCRETDTDQEFCQLSFALLDAHSEEHNVVNDTDKYIRESSSAEKTSGENRILCSKCGAKFDATIKHVVKDYPEVLTLRLEKYDINKTTSVKKSRSVDVKRTLQLSENQTYELYAFVEYFARGGHYTATVKSQDDAMWYNFDNTRVKLLDQQPNQEEDFEKSSTAYLLFYKKKEDNMVGSTPAGLPPAVSDEHSVKMGGSEMAEGATAEVGDGTAIAVADEQRKGKIKNISEKHQPLKEGAEVSDAQGVKDGKTEHQSEKGRHKQESEEKRDDKGDVEKGSRQRKETPQRQQQPGQGEQNQKRGGLNDREQQKSDKQTREQETNRDRKAGGCKPGNSEASVQYKGLLGAPSSLNSVLQVLFMTKDFRKAVERHTSENPQTDHIDRQLTALFDKLKRETARTNDITKKLLIDNVREQRDAAEYIEKILSQSSAEASQIFHGMLTRTTRCLSCDDQTHTDEAFWNLPLPLPANASNQHYSVRNGIEQFFRTSRFNGENQMFCSKCNAKCDATIECAMKDHPEVLMLLLKRFELNYSYRSSVEVPSTLQISENQTYELYAFVDHFGDLYGGVYSTTVKSQDDDKWYDFSSCFVTPCSYQPFQVDLFERSHNAYLLMYRKMAVHVAHRRDMSSEGVCPTTSPDISEEGGNGLKIDSEEAEGDHAQSKDHSEKQQHSGQGAESQITGGLDDSGLEKSGQNIGVAQMKQDVGGKRPTEEEQQQRNEDTVNPTRAASSPGPAGHAADDKEGSSPESVPPVISDVPDPGQDSIKKTGSESEAAAPFINQNKGGGLEVQGVGGQVIERGEATDAQRGKARDTNAGQQVNEGLDNEADNTCGKQQEDEKMSEGVDGVDPAGKSGAGEGLAGIRGTKDSDEKYDLGLRTVEDNKRVDDCSQNKPFPENRSTGSVDGMRQEGPEPKASCSTLLVKTREVVLWRTSRGIEERTQITHQAIPRGGSRSGYELGVKRTPDPSTDDTLLEGVRKLSLNDTSAQERPPTKRASRNDSNDPNTTSPPENPSKKIPKLSNAQEAADDDKRENTAKGHLPSRL